MTIISDLPEGFTVVENEERWTHLTKPHPLDRRYPHSCFNCKRGLKFLELFQANTKNKYYRNGGCFDMPLYRKLKKLWRSKDIEFYCCTCFKLQVW